MNSFKNEEHKERERAELELAKRQLIKMSDDNLIEENEHIFTTIRLAQDAIKHDWYSLFVCHKATISAGMDLVFARVSSAL